MKYVIGVIAIVITAFVAIFAIANRSTPSTQKISTAKPTMVDYANKDASVSYTTQGRIVGDDEFRSVRITVDGTERRIDILSGYENEVIQTQRYDNNRAAYEAFLASLDRANFDESRKSAFTTYKGVCATGNRYLLNITNDGKSVVDTWATSCSRSDGTSAGNISLISRLFQAQITDYSTQVRGVRL